MRAAVTVVAVVIMFTLAWLAWRGPEPIKPVYVKTIVIKDQSRVLPVPRRRPS